MAISGSQAWFHVKPSALSVTQNHRRCPSIICIRSTVPYWASHSLRPFICRPPRINHPRPCLSTGDEKVVDYAEREEYKELMDAIGAELSLIAKIVDNDEGDFQFSMLQALTLVDLTERLGIQRHFKDHINQILKSTFMRWDENRGLKEARVTVLAFRLLRLHGYPVSADTIRSFGERDREASFPTYFSARTLDEISGLLNLYRCSQLSFPCESKIMGEANVFSYAELHAALLDESSPLQHANDLRSEVQFAMEFPRQCFLPRLESKCIIKELWPRDSGTRKYLQLATLDIQLLQKQYQQEILELETWWTQQSFGKVECARRVVTRCLFGIAPTLFEPQFSNFRLAFAKVAYLTIILDDIFDDKRYNIQGLQNINEAVKRWDPSLVSANDIPYHTILVTSICSTMQEIASKTHKAQECDTLPLFKDLWTRFVEAHLTEAEWQRSQYIPTFEEYMKVASSSVGAVIITWSSMFVMEDRITSEIIRHIGPDSHLANLVGYVARLANDTAGFEKETKEGKMATAIKCYQRDNPQLNREEVIVAIKALIRSKCQELELELFMSRDVVPECCSRAVINYARAGCFFYKIEDGFTNDIEEFLHPLKEFFFDPLE